MTRRLRRGTCLAALLAALVLAACQSLSDGARRDFSTHYTCPLDRVEVRARTDLHPSDWFEPRKPPSEVAADPGRLKMWQDQEAERRKYRDEYHSIYEARGCGHQVLYECGRASRGSSTSWICYERAYPAGLAASPGPEALPAALPPASPPGARRR